MIKKSNIAIIGAAGYTGGELLRILIHHPNVDAILPISRSQSGAKISSVHDDLFESDLQFLGIEAIDSAKIDLVFLALGHGESGSYLRQYPQLLNYKIIDLTQEFRAGSQNNTYSFTYGSPEINREKIQNSSYVANPGCFATAMNVALLPIRHFEPQGLYITGITGSTGAGQNPSPSAHYSWRTGNVQPYKALNHQHLTEVAAINDIPKSHLHFIPWRGPFSRGILLSMTLPYEGTAEALFSLYRTYYQIHPFVNVQSSEVHLKQVIGTNHALLSIDVKDGHAVVHVVLDNLLKGASGQAVQNMNLMLGLDETSGLTFKAIGF
jgi:N-acetyl-gamma-glutamyl-phosphate reductase